ncbi:MAG: 30S ribosome-binding factor RbfA [Gammaproteobacteria bacterium]|nr:MAG: 30S ribosome-binding factor RbfA [Gammaproteobacteria bacterium]
MQQENKNRNLKVGDQIHQELAVLINTQLKDPSLNNKIITINELVLTHDLSYARIYVTEITGDESIIKPLNHAKGFLKYHISKKMKLRIMPELEFIYDDIPEKSQKIDELLSKL